jgi:predicted transposase/invertase (TIGR01784 family)
MKYHHKELAEPLIKELCRKEEGIMYAEKALSKVDRDYAKAIRNMNIIKNEYERSVRLEEARKEVKLEFALKMKKAGLTFDQIAEITDLPVETIEEL